MPPAPRHPQRAREGPSLLPLARGSEVGRISWPSSHRQCSSCDRLEVRAASRAGDPEEEGGPRSTAGGNSGPADHPGFLPLQSKPPSGSQGPLSRRVMGEPALAEGPETRVCSHATSLHCPGDLSVHSGGSPPVSPSEGGGPFLQADVLTLPACGEERGGGRHSGSHSVP